MGRPPNPLIVEYFRRGKKLKDKSNRYEHTCRRCGTLDKTGRPEKLIDHLVKCSQLDHDQRQDILARHLNHRIGSRDGQDGMSSRSATPPAYAGLEGLAEAARRVSAHEPPTLSPEPRLSSLPIDPSIDHATTHFYAAVSVPQFKPFTDDLDPARSRTIPTIMETTGPQFGDGYAVVDDSEDHGDRPHRSTSASPHVPLGTLPTTVTSSPTPLSFATPTALPLAYSTQSQPLFQPGLSNNDHSLFFNPTPTTTSAGASDSIFARTTVSTPPDASSASLLADVAVAPVGPSMAADLGDSPKSTRPKRTSKLQPQQREKTAKMRQRGACIRCRLLKKPCSGDDPCQQCQNVHNPRMWRHPCQRVKLHEEISLYSASLHHHLAHQEIRELQSSHGLVEDQPEAVIVVSIGSGESSIQFKAQQFKSRNENRTAQPEQELVSIIEPLPTVISQHDTLKIYRYLKEEYEQLFEREQSPMIRSTLKLSKRLAADKNDEILSAVLELWAATLLLIDGSDCMTMSLTARKGSSSDTAADDTPLTKERFPQSQKLITSQLHAAIETNAASQLHKLLIKLEARLQRPRDTHFETYLACLLLLNCAERTCWFVRQWQMPEIAGQQRPAWPLAKNDQLTPARLAQQGETMASVLHLIMDMRSVLPRPQQASATDSRRHGIDGAGINSTALVAPPRASEDVRAWFNQMDLSTETLRTLEERPYIAGDCRSMDGRFWARTLAVEDGAGVLARPPAAGA